MTNIELSKAQLEKLVRIYENLKEFDDFSVTIEDSNTVSVKLNVDKFPEKDNKTWTKIRYR
jgi:hypothetical protein